MSVLFWESMCRRAELAGEVLIQPEWVHLVHVVGVSGQYKPTMGRTRNDTFRALQVFQDAQ